MSHFTRISTRIRDRETLLRCVEQMGHEAHEGGTIRGHAGRRRVDIRVPLERGYEIGFIRANDGAYDLVADWSGVRDTSGEQFLRQLEGQFSRMQGEIMRQQIVQTVLAKSRQRDLGVVRRRW